MPSWYQPTSPAFAATIAVLLAGVLIWGVGWLPLHRTGRVAAVVKQGLATLGAMVLALALVAVVLNQQNQWYPSWRSMGGISDQASVANHGATVDQAAEAAPWGGGDVTALQADPRKNTNLGAQTWQDPAPNGQYLMVNITGPVSGITAPTLIWLPPSYLAHPERKYPVILAFQGVPGSVDAFRQNLPMGELITQLGGEQKIRESIVVAPMVFPNNLDTECVNTSDGSSLTDTFVSTDLVAWMYGNLRVVDDPQAWATFGYSAGGYCAAMFAMRYPQTFSHAMNMSGAFQPHFEGPALLADGDPNYDLIMIAGERAPAVNLWFWGTKDDALPHDSLQKLTAQVRPPTSLTTALLETGGHGWPVWSAGVRAALPWLGATSTQFAWIAP